MRAPILAAALLAAGPALADEVASATASPTRSQVVDKYPERLADRPRAIGAGLFEAGWQGGWQFNDVQGFGEVPDVRYGLTDALELTLLGARYVVAEDGRNYPGLAIRGQLHDLAYQAHGGTNFNYPLLRPGVFAEFRDRLPYHLTLNALIGYSVSIQAARAADGSRLQDGQRVSDGLAPLLLEVQWSPLALLSFNVRGGYLEDAYVAAPDGVTQSDAVLTVGAAYTSSRFDVRVFYTSNWFADPKLGYVPELGAGVALRL